MTTTAAGASPVDCQVRPDVPEIRFGDMPRGAVYTRALGTVGAAMYTYTADQMRAYAAKKMAAERERCAALCLRPPGWLSDSHQALASEIRNAILGNAGCLQGPNVASKRLDPVLRGKSA
jgi:hypothetical protein